jgi:hypothetical protein
VTPTAGPDGKVTGYHSNRRVPERRILDGIIVPLYSSLLEEESRHQDRKAGLQSSWRMLERMLQEKGVGYDELVLTL